MRSRKFSAVTGALVLAVGCASCGDGGTGGATDAGSEPGADVPEAVSVVEECAASAPNTEEAGEPVDTAALQKEEPWVLGVSAASLTSSSYIVYWNQELKYAVSQDDRFADLIEYDAAYDASQQISDIQSLIRQNVSAIIFTPSDNAAIEPALQQAREAGIPTIMGTSAFIPDPNITATVTVDLFKYYSESAARLFEAMGGTGQVAMLRTIAGTTEDEIQTQAVDCVLKSYPDIEIVAEEFATYTTQEAQQAGEAWAVRFPELAGILSVYAETSTGVFNAFNAVGRAGELKFSPGNAQNGWLRVLSTHEDLNLGGVEYPVTTSVDTVEVAGRILSGEEVTQATLLGGEYIEPDEYLAQFEQDQPDSYWPNDLPDEFLPNA
jgi:ABC-type sugar transport system substrate-binding protein